MVLFCLLETGFGGVEVVLGGIELFMMFLQLDIHLGKFFATAVKVGIPLFPLGAKRPLVVQQLQVVLQLEFEQESD